ncbi:MAG: hypothetical protein WC552_02145 [Candidatus Omnitrophota bacterium]
MRTAGSIEYDKKYKNDSHIINDKLRQHVLECAKRFKSSWIGLGQTLYPIWKDKLYHAWGHEKFDDYAERELGIKKELAVKLLKLYFFLEQEETTYLKENYDESRQISSVTHYDAVDLLRLAKNKKELDRTDYMKLRKNILEEGKEASSLKKDLTALIRERRVVDPEEERDKRYALAVRKFLYAIQSFTKDMETLKLIPDKIIEEAAQLQAQLEGEIS